MSIRIASTMWMLVGLALCSWCIWGLFTEYSFPSAIASWCIGLGYGVIAAAGGALTLKAKRMGTWLLVCAACVGLLYAIAYWLFHGPIDAPSYLPGVVGLVVLSVFTLLLFPDIEANAT